MIIFFLLKKTYKLLLCASCQAWHRVQMCTDTQNYIMPSVQFSQFSCSVVSDSLWPYESQHARPPYPSPTPGVHSDSHPLSRWCHPAISSSVVPFSSCLQSLAASGSFPMSQFFTWGGQSIGVSASVSVLPMDIQDWSPLGWTGWISLQSKGLSRVFSGWEIKIKETDRFDQKIARLGLFKAGTTVLTSFSLEGIIISKSPSKSNIQNSTNT